MARAADCPTEGDPRFLAVTRTGPGDESTSSQNGDGVGLLERVGRFEIHGPLGLGGMGTVFRARDVDTGAWVALKRVKVDRAAYLDALRREIHALGRIDHPGVVRVVDQGVANGLPWYAMELLEGPTLGELVTGLHARGEPKRFADFLPLLAVVRRLCETLAFLHGEGVVHRDLTPNNVIVRADGAPVLVDFGLATQFPAPGREAFELDLPRAGTPFFAAPEQRLHNVVDARADIYALGSLLLYAFTGVAAPGQDPTTVPADGQHAPAPAVARRPSERVSDLPAALEDVIMRALAPLPRDRLGFATDVARALDLAGVQPPPPAWCRPARSYVYRAAMFGRDEPLERLVGVVERGRDGHGGLALVAGESGVGKTRLALELASIARARGLRVLSGASVNVGAGPRGPSGAPEALHAFRPLVQAVLDYCRQRGPDEAQRILGGRGADLALAFPDVRELLPPDSQSPVDVPADESRFRLIEALSRVLARFASGTPLFVMLDDLQWADQLSLAVIESLATGVLVRSPIVIVGTYRSEELGPGPRRALRAVATVNVDLGRLEAGDITTLIGDMLALPQPPQDLARLLERESEGNPFFVAEYLRVAVEEGWLARDQSGAWRMASKGAVALSRADSLPTPQVLFDVLDRRLAGLGADARRMCALAAVAGRELPAELIRRAFGPGQEGFFDAMNELLVRQVLEGAGSDSVRFVHDKLREAAYARIDHGELLAHHRTVALALEADAADGRFDAQLAHHWRVAEDTKKEAPYRLAAGEQAYRVGAYHEAILHLSRALELLPADTAPSQRARLERHVGEAYFGVGDMPASRRQLASAAAQAGLAAPATPAAQVVTAAGDVVASIAINLTRRLRARPEAALRRRLGEAARCFERLAHVLFFENETLAVASSSLRALRVASQMGPSAELARILGNLSISAALVPFHPMARFLAGHAQRIARDAGDEAARAWVTQLDGVYHAGIGDWRPALASLEHATEEWDRIGHRRRWEECLTLLGMVVYHSGDRARATELRATLLAAGTASRSPQTIGWALIGQGEDSLAAGDAATAREKLAAALELGPAIRRVEEIWARGMLARALLAGGDRAAARAEAARATELAAGTIPTAFYAAEGYAGMSAVLATEKDATARRASRALRRFVRVFPIAAPLARSEVSK